jgi:hypothetical protein
MLLAAVIKEQLLLGDLSGFWSKGKGVGGGCRKLQNDKLHNF